MDYVKSVGEYAEFALYAFPVGKLTPATVVDLISTLEQQKSQEQVPGEALCPVSRCAEPGRKRRQDSRRSPKSSWPVFPTTWTCWRPGRHGIDAAAERPRAELRQPGHRRIRQAQAGSGAGCRVDPEENRLLGRAYWIAGMVAGAKNDFQGRQPESARRAAADPGQHAMLGPPCSSWVWPTISLASCS